MLNLLPPRFFCDFTVPRRADGSLLLSCRDSADYKTYVRWLSDYLHTADLPLSPEQQDWLLDTRPDAHQAIFACSDIYGYALFQLEDIVNDIEAGRSYEDFRAAWLKGYETELSTEDREREGPFEQWMDCSKAVYERIVREYWQEQAAGQEWSHADIPFRSLLSWALRQIPDADKRYREMDFYFINFDDNASK